MRKRRLFCDWFLVLMILLCILECYPQFGYCCEFDNIISNDIVRAFVNYSSKHKRDMNKAEVSVDFKPIRIHVYYGIMDHGMAAEQTTRLFSVVEKARNKISQLLSVKQVSGPLLLPREKACDKLWGPYSRNQNKCSSIRQGYVGEFCENKIDYFQIPDDHLAGLNVYNFTSPHPLPLSLPAGNGVKNADYILYVNAQNTHLCQTQDIIAYASYCILDQHDRPIAGFINFCPFHLQEKHDEKRTTLVAIHELFHALGFSQDMFKKFKDCSSVESIPCTEWKRPITTDKHNINRLSLPTVIKKMQEHFGCDDVNFGAPLGTKKNDEIDSHWNSVMLHGSIMSPDITFAEYVSIDPISAAVFSDSGWYQVNFSNTDDYFWGRGEGCDFAVKETCGDPYNKYFCSMTDYKRMKGCDYLHLTETYCHKIGHWKKCGVYKLNSTNKCQTAESTNETISACVFLTNENKSNSFCGVYKCLENGGLKIYTDDFWIDCTHNSKIIIEYYGERYNVLCPDWNVICSTKYRKNLLAKSESSEKFDEIEIYFSLTSMDEILKMGTIEELHIAALKHLQLESKVNIIPESSKIVRIEDYYIMKVNVILPSDIQTKLLKEFVMNGRFLFTFKSKLEVSAIGMRINESVKEGNEAIEDYLLFIILAVIVITIMIVVAIILGYYRYKKWKPPNN